MTNNETYPLASRDILICKLCYNKFKHNSTRALTKGIAM